MIRVGHEARMEGKRNQYKILDENLKGRDQLKDLCMDWRTILKRILEKSYRAGFIWLSIRSSRGLLLTRL
jgi:hypothetical protein